VREDGFQVREVQNYLPFSIWNRGLLFWYKKPVIPKKKVFDTRTLKDYLPNLPLERGKAKKKIKVFLSRQFCASLNKRSRGVTIRFSDEKKQ
jgi:hypothetical protein